MSDRSLMLPDRALQLTLSRLQNRLMSAQRRIRFPGATQMVTAAGPTSVSTTYVDLLTVTLDPGRWLIMGGFWTTITASVGGDGPYWITSQFYTGAATSPVYEVGQEHPGTVDPKSDCSMPSWTIVMPTGGTVTMRAKRGGVLVTANLNDIYLIAAPG